MLKSSRKFQYLWKRLTVSVFNNSFSMPMEEMAGRHVSQSRIDKRSFVREDRHEYFFLSILPSSSITDGNIFTFPFPLSLSLLPLRLNYYYNLIARTFRSHLKLRGRDDSNDKSLLRPILIQIKFSTYLS